MTATKILWACGHRPAGSKKTRVWYQEPSHQAPSFTTDLATTVKVITIITESR